jgi:hypothetical protein
MNYESYQKVRRMKIALGLAAIGLTISASLQAQTADDCIVEYENLKSQFEATAADAELSCITEGTLISLEREGAFPDFCRGKGSWDHWHLEAKATGNKEGSCTMLLRGQEGVDGCGTEEFKLELPANEAAAWRKYLKGECG